MTTRRVSILYVDEGERAEAAKLLLAKPPPEIAGDYLIGLVDDAGLSALVGSGLIFNAEPERTPPPAAAPAAAAFAVERLEDQAVGVQTDRIIIRLARPFSAAIGQALSEAGATIERRGSSSTFFAERQNSATLQQRINGSVYVARFTGRDLSVITDIPAVDSAQWYDVRATLGDSLAAEVAHRLSEAASSRGLTSLSDTIRDIIGSVGDERSGGLITSMAADGPAEIAPRLPETADRPRFEPPGSSVRDIAGNVGDERSDGLITSMTTADGQTEAAPQLPEMAAGPNLESPGNTAPDFTDSIGSAISDGLIVPTDPASGRAEVARQRHQAGRSGGFGAPDVILQDMFGRSSDTTSGGVIASATPDKPATVEETPYDLRCHDSAALDRIADQVEAIPGVIRIEKGTDRLRYWTSQDPAIGAALLTKIATLNGVEKVERYLFPEPLLNCARGVLWGGRSRQGVGRWQGEGELVAITDSGIDEDHPDFAGRWETVYHAGNVSKHDPVGHGTHVASILAGDGSASDGLLAGIAPKARLFVQCIANANGGFTGLGVGLRKLMQEAFDKGARIQNFSWGSPVYSRYVLDSLELDEFVAENPDHLIVVAAGNWGAQDLQDPAHRIGLMSLGAPANAKNCLAVGACCSPREDGPYAGKTWAQYNGSSAPRDPPMAGLPLTGDADIVASLSSRGPSDSGLVKPDLVAVGVGVVAARSRDYAGQAVPWPEKPESYIFMTGTSMAAPVVSGAAAVLREYLIKQRNHKPSAALLKATLINGARWISNSVQEDTGIGEPNFHQGFGRLDLTRTFPVDDAATFALTFIDIGNDDPQAVQMARPPTLQGVNWRKRFAVTSSDQVLSVTMCWTDPPSRSLEHELDLLVIAPDGTKHVGNAALVRLPTQKTDRVNNVEKIIIESPAVGEWAVMVTAFNTFRHPQGFAVAATGAITDWIG